MYKNETDFFKLYGGYYNLVERRKITRTIDIFLFVVRSVVNGLNKVLKMTICYKNSGYSV